MFINTKASYSLNETKNKVACIILLTGHYREREPASISSLAADIQTQLRRDVFKELGMDDQVFEICKVPE
jgi:hypothetical protein